MLRADLRRYDHILEGFIELRERPIATLGRRRLAECIARAGQEPWHYTLGRFHWRLLGHVAGIPKDSICYALRRTGGLWHEHMLRALRTRGTHRRPGPQRHIDKSASASTRDRFDCWVENRGTWRSMKDELVRTAAPLTRWDDEA